MLIIEIFKIKKHTYKRENEALFILSAIEMIMPYDEHFPIYEIFFKNMFLMTIK